MAGLQLNVRKYAFYREDVVRDEHRAARKPAARVACAAVFADPFAGDFVEDLTPLIEAGAELSDLLVEKLVKYSGVDPGAFEAFGKAVAVGSACDIEHGHAVLHPRLGEALRRGLGGIAIVPSTTVRGPPGTVISVPLHHKRAAYVSSHFDTLTVMVDDSPLSNEIVLVAAASYGGRPNPRIGGLRAEDAKGVDGLR